jgi:hypothetical protein
MLCKLLPDQQTKRMDDIDYLFTFLICNLYNAGDQFDNQLLKKYVSRLLILLVHSGWQTVETLLVSILHLSRLNG